MVIEFVVRLLSYVLFYSSLVGMFIVFIPKWDIEENTYSEDQKWFSFRQIGEFVKKSIIKLFHLALILCVAYLSSRGIMYYMQPRINKVFYTHNVYEYSDTLMSCDTESNKCYTIKNTDKAYNPTRKDICIYCGYRYWRHHKIETESERDIRNYIIQSLATDP